jgi:hypothetical protein
LEHPIQVCHHVTIGEPDDPIAALFERAGAGRVIGLSFAVGVSVELDDEAVAAAGEVGDVGGEDDLPLELGAEAVAAEMVPQAAFGFGEVGAQGFGADSRDDVPLNGTAPSPRSASLSRPLPLKGARVGVRHLLSSLESVQSVNA